MKRKLQVKTVIFMTVKRQKYLSAGIFCAVVGAILLALVPPLILARIVDTITAGKTAACSFLLLYFASACRCRFSGVGKGRASDGLRAENHTCAAQRTDGKIYGAYSG